ncbi:MAG TPA: ice-binding family protein [Candidatus Paceibacterota bacterium]
MEASNKNVVRVWLFALLLLVLIVLASLTVWYPGLFKNIIQSGGPQPAAVALVDLSSSGNFAILAGSGITNTGATTVTGDVGSYATLTQTGFGPGADSVTITGTNHFGDSTTQTAKTDLVTAYNFAAAEGPTSPIVADLGGQTLTPGVYNSASTIGLTGVLTLDGQGDPNATFVFQAGSALTTLSGSSVHLINGAQACHVFWQVGSDATLGTGSTFRGSLIALSSITVTTGATVDGRVLARNGAVTLDTNAIAVPSTCTSAVPTATLHVIKTVINTTVGTSAASDFSIHVKSATSTLDVPNSPQAGAGGLGTSYTLVQGATYNVSEASNALPYTQTFGGACAPSGSVTLAAGDNICTVINSDIPLAVAAPASGGGYNAPLPLIKVIKIPNPLALPSGPGPVTYTYTATNIGTVAMHGVWVKDNDCSPVTYISGDTNSNSLLDTDEAWVYTCTKTVSATVTNTASAHGQANGWDTYAFANATVVVGAPISPPLINIVKVPSRLTPLPSGGGTVTYTYTVTNPGVVDLHEVQVTDDKCAPVSLISGDTNGDHLLQPDETWVYTCRTNISVSTRNVATALGKANDLIALGYAFATVLVSTLTPTLPNTGIPPQEDTAPLAAPSIIPTSQNLIDNAMLTSLQGVDLGPQASVEAPTRLTIPGIAVDSALEAVHLTPEGAVGAPETPMNAAWFELSPPPGENGTAVIVGHFGWKDGIPAVFDDLHTLHQGDKVYVEDAKGATTTFVVREVRSYGEDEDSSDVFSSSDGKAHLNLITCGGVWDSARHSYSNRVVVFTDKE